MAVDFAIAIVGSGPAGLSAAAHAAKKGVKHILLERADHVNDTIFKYQKRKHVMATPEFLPLRSDLDFKEESREEVIEAWTGGVEGAKANIRLNCEVKSIGGQKGNFQLALSTGETITAEYVVLSIGVQGNLRKFGAIKGYEAGEAGDPKRPSWHMVHHSLDDPTLEHHAGEVAGEKPLIQYQLDDPDEYKGEEIIVVGCGDAGIENAVGLAKNNNVTIINTMSDFPYAKPANAALVQGMIKSGAMFASFDSELLGVDEEIVVDGNATPEKVRVIGDKTYNISSDSLFLVLNKKVNGEQLTERVPCDRIIARIGALPPRKFVESCGVEFASASPTSFPHVSDTYESNVPGLYVIGALAGYPLIKHCLNQGYEVVEYILGNNIPPADEPLLQAMIDKAGVKLSVTDLVTEIRERLPIYKPLTALQIREFLLHSELHNVKPGEIVFHRNDYTNSLYSVLDGEVGIQIDPAKPDQMVRLGVGKFFGEMGLISGRRRSATVVATQQSLLLEVDRNTMVKLTRTMPEIKAVVDRDAVVRQIETYLAPGIDEVRLHEVLESAKVVEFKANETLIEEGAEDDDVFIIRSGSVTVSRKIAGRDIVLGYLPAGNYVGEMAMLTKSKRSATVKAAVASEAIKINSAAFRALLEHAPELREQVEERLEHRLMEQRRMQLGMPQGGLIEFLIRQGLGEATDVLLIDESLCVRCDNCEKACAETHHGVSRLDREAGPTYNAIHVPTSCRHCEHPHCMKDCPADAIHRAPNGEVFIDDKCIGCGNCERNCPYHVIQMAAVPAEKPGLLSWLLFGMGFGPGEDKTPAGLARRTGSKHAVKCDMCKGIDGGPSCVRACPTGAAIRVNPEDFIKVVRGIA